MNRPESTYQAVLFRGWCFVRLRYELEGEHVVIHEKRTLRREIEKKVSLAGLDSDAHRVWARQPAYRASFILILIAFVILGYDFLAKGRAPSSVEQVDWRAWGPAIGIGLVGWIVMYTTRKRREWTHFPGNGGAAGLFILQQRDNAAAHKAFVEKIRRRIERRQDA